MRLDIPNKGNYDIKNIALDYNGTLATDGEIEESTLKLLSNLAKKFNIYILSADTHGSITKKLKEMPFEVIVVSSENGQKDKADFIKQIGAEETIAIGNGNIDILMFREAIVSIGIMGSEGIAVKALLEADIVVENIRTALNLIENPLRIIATLR